MNRTHSVSHTSSSSGVLPEGEMLASSGGPSPTVTSPVAVQHVAPCSSPYLVSFVSLVGQSFYIHSVTPQGACPVSTLPSQVPRVHLSPTPGGSSGGCCVMLRSGSPSSLLSQSFCTAQLGFLTVLSQPQR